jgi:hypothetical protein
MIIVEITWSRVHACGGITVRLSFSLLGWGRASELPLQGGEQFSRDQGVHFVLIYQESPDFGPDFLIS